MIDPHITHPVTNAEIAEYLRTLADNIDRERSRRFSITVDIQPTFVEKLTRCTISVEWVEEVKNASND